jgi:hypothetical protein
VSAAWWLTALFAGGGGQAHAAGWLAPVNATPAAGTFSEPRVAIDDRGDIFAAWLVPTGDFAPTVRVQVSKRPLGGEWELPQTLDQPSMAGAESPDIGVDGAGNAVVVWALGGQIWQARRSASAAEFETPVAVPAAAGTTESGFPRIAVNRAGAVGLAWSAQTSSASGVVVAAGDSTSSIDASTVQAYFGPTDVTAPDVAIDPAGDIAAIWQANDGSSTSIQATYRPDGGGFPAASEPVDGASFDDPHVALDSRGEAVALYKDSADGSVQASHRPAGGSAWSQLSELDGPSTTGSLDVAVDNQDSAVAAWVGNNQLRTSARPVDGAFGKPPPQILADHQEAPVGLSMEASAQGTIALGWRGNLEQTMRAAIRPPGGSFGALATLSAGDRFATSPDIAAGFTGNAAAVWVDTDQSSGDPRVASAVYDATAPVIGGVQTPATAATGVTVPMTAGATDDWSVPAIAWDFGDGSTGEGGAVSHAYAAVGSYEVTVTATDSVGNVAATTRTIDVRDVDVPTRGVDFNASSVAGTVLVSVPKNAPAGRVLARPVVRGAAAIRPPRGYRPFRRLRKDDNIPVGSILDASRGTSALSMATSSASDALKLQKGRFSKGVFKTRQSRKASLTTLTMLGGGDFKKGCSAGNVRKGGVSGARKRPRRRLFSNAHGRFRTRGRNSTATVRGTKWSMTDTCKGTRTSVSRGSVTVRDLRKHRTVTVRRGHSYLARSPKRG